MVGPESRTRSSVQPGPSLPAIQAALSAPRFQPYLDAAGQSPQRALELYEWNESTTFTAFPDRIQVAGILDRHVDRKADRVPYEKLSRVL
jgi:hypothetical protein